MSITHITVRGARQHNLKNIDVDIPRDKFVVITGLSGSGKSSLAFDTIYAEGQRRYVESLSAYARQFLDQLEKPDVDSVEGLSPAISIEQKTVSRSPRSTVGTVTEIYDFLRLLFSSIGQPHCQQCGEPITRQSVDQIVSGISELPDGERVMILAPVVRGRKGEFKKELEKLHKDGFLRARVDGELRQLDEEIILDKRKNHTIEVVVDRLLMKDGVRERLSESVKTALKLTGGAVLISIIDGDEKLYSEKMACVNCGINIPTLEPRSFSFNSAFGACKRCQGIGTVMEIDAKKIVPNESVAAGKIDFLNGADKAGATLVLTGEASLHDSVINLTQESSLLAYIALSEPTPEGNVSAARPSTAWVMNEMNRFASAAEEFARENKLTWFDLNGQVERSADNFFSDVLLTDAGAAKAGKILAPVLEPVIRAKAK